MSQSLILLASVAAVLVLLASSASAQNTVELQSAMGSSTLTVMVQYVAGGGAPPAREPGQLGPSGPRWVESPAPGVVVRVVRADTSPTAPVASAATDETGHATFTLPAGAYLVVVPTAPSDSPGRWGPVITRQLPDGTLVSGMANVDLRPDASSEVIISLVAPLP